MVPVELRDEYREYHDKVVKITNKQDLSTLTNIEKRGVIGKDEDAYHVDHIFSIYDGFMNDVPADVIGNICNLQCIPGLINITKRNDSWITLKELYDRYEHQYLSLSMSLFLLLHQLLLPYRHLLSQSF